MTLGVGSLFSGIGGMDYGLHRAGFEHVFFCESDPWRREILAARWPGVPVYDNVRRVANEPPSLRRGGTSTDAAIVQLSESRRERGTDGLDLLCGGFPCQDLSVAGRRRGLAGERSGLFFELARIIDTFRPGWVLIENVPGLLSSNGGRDFGVVLGTLADLGYGVAWRVLDSRFFGVPQRRRRVFIVGALAVGDPRAAAERAGQVLAVGSRCEWHPTTRGEAGPRVPDASTVSTLAGSGKSGGWQIGADEAAGGQLVAAPLTKGSAIGEGVNAPGRRQEDDVNIVSYNWQSGDDVRLSLRTSHIDALSKSQVPAVGVRRLTPRECERLQALPDDWTLLEPKTPDSRRYCALGDAVTASVAEWIGRRLAA